MIPLGLHALTLGKFPSFVRGSLDDLPGFLPVRRPAATPGARQRPNGLSAPRRPGRRVGRAQGGAGVFYTLRQESATAKRRAAFGLSTSFPSFRPYTPSTAIRPICAPYAALRSYRRGACSLVSVCSASPCARFSLSFSAALGLRSIPYFLPPGSVCEVSTLEPPKSSFGSSKFSCGFDRVLSAPSGVSSRVPGSE